MATVFNFFKHFSTVKGEQLGDSLMEFAANHDADGVSETFIKQKLEEQEQMVSQLVEAKRELEREEREYKDIETLYNKRLAAAQRAKNDLAQHPDDITIKDALEELLLKLEELVPQVAKEKKEFEFAKTLVEEYQKAADDLAKDLKGLRKQINDTKNSIKQADLEKQRSQKRREQVEQLNGLRNTANKFNVAMDALQKRADKAKAEAETNNIIVESLKKPEEVTGGLAAKYLDEAKEESSALSLEERLAKLTNKE
jgi:hypothetical protein